MVRGSKQRGGCWESAVQLPEENQQRDFNCRPPHYTTTAPPTYDERAAAALSDAAAAPATAEANTTALEITLIRGAKGFGFSFVTEKGRHFIKQMTPETQASGLRTRDEIVTVNSQRTLNCDHGQVKQMVINSPPKLALSLLR